MKCRMCHERDAESYLINESQGLCLRCAHELVSEAPVEYDAATRLQSRDPWAQIAADLIQLNRLHLVALHEHGSHSGYAAVREAMRVQTMLELRLSTLKETKP